MFRWVDTQFSTPEPGVFLIAPGKKSGIVTLIMAPSYGRGEDIVGCMDAVSLPSSAGRHTVTLQEGAPMKKLRSAWFIALVVAQSIGDAISDSWTGESRSTTR